MPILTLQPGPTDGIDVFIDSTTPDTNKGTDIACRIGVLSLGPTRIRRALMRFDISAIPAGSTINSATIEGWRSFVEGTAEPAAWYRLTRTDWVESQVTWNDYKSGSPWTTAGGDYSTTEPAGDTFTLPTAASPNPYSISIPNLVKDAVDNRGGVLNMIGLRTSEASPIAHWSFYSSDWGTASERAKLTIDYTAIPLRSKLRAPYLERPADDRFSRVT